MEKPFGAKRPWLHLWGSWQPEWADLSARRRYASEQPPQAALSESQRGCRPYSAASLYFVAHPLSFAFAQQLPQRGRRGRFAPGVTPFTDILPVSEQYRHRAGQKTNVSVQGSQRHFVGVPSLPPIILPVWRAISSPGGLGNCRIGTIPVASLKKEKRTWMKN